MRMPEGASISYPPISDLINPTWIPNNKRLLVLSIDNVITMSNALEPKRPHWFPESTLADLNKGLLLDVGCGIHFGIDNTLVDFLPNAYGIDPALLIDLKHRYGMGTPPKDKVVGGFSEDMPFNDKLFKWTLSLKCVGWYPNVTINPFWAISEMVRVTEDGGLIMIHIGQSNENVQIILEAAQQVKNGPLGKRITSVDDFTFEDFPQVSIRLVDA